MTNKIERNASTTHGHVQSNGHGHSNGNGHSKGHGNGHSDDHTPPPTPPQVASFVFAANNGILGTEPWVSDGTEAGTHLLLDLNPGPDGSGFYSASPFVSGSTTFVPASDGLFVFAASDSAHGYEIWVTDGTTQGTTLLADLEPGPSGSFPYLFAPLDDGLVLFGTTGGSDFERGTRFSITDGTVSGTRRAPQFESGTPFFGAGEFGQLEDGRVLFTFASELRIATVDGTSSDLVLSFPQSQFNAALGYVTPLDDGRALFRADDGIHGIEPWITDGTADGTYQIADLNPGSEGSFVAGFVGIGDGLALFSAFDFTHGRELWITDGTEAGTRLVSDINPGIGSNSLLDLTPIGGGRLLFSASDGVHGDELWVTDGSEAGTMMVQDIYPGLVQSGGPNIPSLGSSFPSNITPLGDGRALFSAADPEHGQELWVSDGTPAGTHIVADLMPGMGPGSPSGIVAIGHGLAAFSIDDGTTGREPWITDGTEDGTYRLADINSGAAGSGATGFTPLADLAPIG